MSRVLAVAVAFVAMGSALFAGDVKVDGVHLCCGKCLKGVDTALKGIEGVSKVSCNKDAGLVRFTATDMDAAKAAVAALAKAGYYGSASMGDAVVPYPATGIEEGAKSNSVSISGVHLCCGGCITSAEGALEGVSGVSELSSDGKAGTISVKGSDMSLQALLDALHSAGFHGTVK
ncbi:MAG: heavy-metal-associated domain-containing protein [Planctomycetaceae bacterium]|nr:heavy-metal-associated domain-containing protein [Planctomycetaceae bacterium]MCB9952509.1 heavy-metal-associated domain-containing protein [Planctomycetaceae bacterium]